MERAPKQPQSNEQMNARNTAQLSAVLPAQDHATSLIDTSPYVTGQSKSLQALFGDAAVQRVEDEEEPLQGRFETVQRVEDEEKEEPVQGKFAAVQRVEDEEEPLQGRFETVQRVEDEEEPVQGKFAAVPRVEDEEEPLQGRFEPVQRVGREAKEEVNNTGLPDNLKAGVESLSGISLNNVRVHYNSSQPAQLSALAYAQGNDIHVAPGQEQHLPHEAWHVVQQAQGRVKPTMQAKGTPINDDKSLESEADEMGRMAASPAIYETQKSAASVTQRTKPVSKGKGISPGNDAWQTRKRKEKLKGRKQDMKVNARGHYTLGKHGFKKKEQQRLTKMGQTVTGRTHESEHAIGYAVIAATPGQRGKTSTARELENLAPAYQEVRLMHRAHIGTGSRSDKDNSGFNSQQYRETQRTLLEANQVGIAVQINQLGYAFINGFGDAGIAADQADASYDAMVTELRDFTYEDPMANVTIGVTPEERAEMYLARKVAKGRVDREHKYGGFPSPEDENEAREKFGLPLLKLHNSAPDDDSGMVVE